MNNINNNLNLDKDNIYNNCNNNTFNNTSNTEINLELSTNQNQNEVLLKDIVENFLQKKISKENEHKYQIKQNKKNILEKFYSMTNIDYLNQQSKNKIQEAEFNFNNQNNNNNNNNANQMDDYDEIREKYKIERNKKKSSIFKSEDLHISNTNVVHINKNEDYSPINPNVVDIENKNNIFIIQKKLFGDNDINNDGDVEKIEDIDEIELDFSEINNNKYEESQILSSNNKNIIEAEKTIEKKNIDNNNIITNVDTNNNNNYFSNDILVRKKEIDLCFTRDKINFKKVNGISSLGFVINNLSKRNNGNNNYPFKYINDNNSNLIQNGENSKIVNKMAINDFRNNKLKKNNTDYTDFNGNLVLKEYEENDNSNNTIVPINQNNNTNNNYNGKYTTYDNKLINGSNDYQNINKIKNNYLIKNKYLQKNKTSNNKNNSFQNNVAYIDYRNISGRVNINNNNKTNQNKNNILDKNLIKPKNFKLKKKNNSFVLNRDINKINNNVANKSIYQTLSNNNNKIIFCNDNNYNSNTQKNLLNYNNEINNGKNQNNKVIPIISKMPISLKVKKNLMVKNGLKNSTKNTKRKIGNKISVLNTLLNNNLLLFQKANHQQEAIEKLKSRQNNGVYFIYVDKVNEGYSFKGIYKRGTSEINHICNKIYGIPNSPLILLYEKFYILVENEDKTFEFKKLSDINVFSFLKTILLIKNK